ncbi:hypothetical protein [Mariprofundus sp. EBB-1]|uniref:hypothetical protein n=1 Tax=Mariprofundus sp. EBB-1 TaxID=2650971 RepID=UPI0019122DA6|nr:hypothetical protein [Mariprofundus sp. EBB-1]
MMLTLHEDAFYEFFRPYLHPQASCDVWGGIGLEAYGADLELVKSLPTSHLWTVVDGDDSNQWILAGIHTVIGSVIWLRRWRTTGVKFSSKCEGAWLDIWVLKRGL